MIAFPNCKINIGLYITGKRPDGYHDLQSVFYPLLIKDAIEIIDDNKSTGVNFSTTGILPHLDDANNLCVKAYQLLKKDFHQLPCIKMHLHKAIPVGAGLGGGSADAAFTLQLINKQYSLGLGTLQLQNYALQLGSDCPFFIKNKPCFVSGRGEVLEEIQLDLSAYKIALVNPGIHINTGWAFSSLENIPGKTNLKDSIAQPINEWHKNISNDFEHTIFKTYPEISAIKSQLYDIGALYASMSGSGSSVYAIFEKKAAIPFNFPGHYFCKWA